MSKWSVGGMTEICDAGRQEPEWIALCERLGADPETFSKSTVGGMKSDKKVSKMNAFESKSKPAKKTQVSAKRQASMKAFNEKNEETRKKQQAERFQCPNFAVCKVDCSRGNRAWAMTAHLLNFVKCRQSNAVKGSELAKILAKAKSCLLGRGRASTSCPRSCEGGSGLEEGECHTHE